jgi:hypothetical protein
MTSLNPTTATVGGTEADKMPTPRLDIKTVYKKYKHLDSLLSEPEQKDFLGTILFDLWQAIKSEQNTALCNPTPESGPLKQSSKLERVWRYTMKMHVGEPLRLVGEFIPIWNEDGDPLWVYNDPHDSEGSREYARKVAAILNTEPEMMQALEVALKYVERNGWMDVPADDSCLSPAAIEDAAIEDMIRRVIEKAKENDIQT